MNFFQQIRPETETGGNDAPTLCTLCGLPASKPPLTADGNAFCCAGCQTVYTSFGPDVLARAPLRPAPPTPEQQARGKEAFLRVEGMHCSSCEILLERIAAEVPGVLSSATSYATSTAKIVYDPDLVRESDLPRALSVSGYRARLSTDDAPEYDDAMPLLRLLVGTALAGLVMMLYIAFFYPSHLGLVDEDDLKPVAWLAYQVAPWAMFLATSGLVAYVAAPIFRGAWIGLKVQVLNMDNLLAIAILAAYGYSTVQLLSGSLDLYFDVSATLIAVVTIGRYVERNAKAEATRELTRIIEKWSPKARIRWAGGFRMQAVEDLEPGEHVIIREGESVPVDGTILYGTGAVDESLMTGEPFPVPRGPGEQVLGGAVVVEGELEIRVGPVVESQMDTLARILWSVQSAGGGARTIADMLARLFVPLVLVLAGLVTFGALLFGGDLRAAVLAGLATLIVSCPCTFGLAIPLTTAVGVSTALRDGIIVSSADAFEKLSGIDIIAIDKTGTLSSGEVTVLESVGGEAMLARAAAVERLSPHPIARAVARLDDGAAAEDLEPHPGKGAVATVDGRRVAVGSRFLFSTLGWDIPAALDGQARQRTPSDGAVSFVGWDGEARGFIVTRDRDRARWREIVAHLRRHCRVVLLTGAEHPGGYGEEVDEVFAGIPPEGKAAVIRQLRKQGRVVMIGDGSNDAPALAEADLGIAFGAPTSLAAEAADVIIPGDRLEKIFTAFNLIETIRRRVRQNLGWAMLYNALAIPMAVAGVLNPLFAALAMSSSSLLVVWNSSRAIGGGDQISSSSRSSVSP